MRNPDNIEDRLRTSPISTNDHVSQSVLKDLLDQWDQPDTSYTIKAGWGQYLNLKTAKALAAAVILVVGIAVVIQSGKQPGQTDALPQETMSVSDVNEDAESTISIRPSEPDNDMALARSLFEQNDIPGLLALMQNSSQEVQIATAGYLAQIGDEAALPILQTLADQWEGALTDNPFVEAIEAIQARLATEQNSNANNISDTNETDTGEPLMTNSGAGTMAGVVLDEVTLASIRGAIVQITLPDTNISAQTNTTGRFKLLNVPTSDNILVSVTANGYMSQRFTVPVLPDQVTQDIRIELTPLGPAGDFEIEVVSKQGEPVSDADVHVYPEMGTSREPHLPIIASGKTNDLGKFNFTLQPEWETKYTRAYVYVKSKEGYLGLGRYVNWKLKPSKITVDIDTAPIKLRIIDWNGNPISDLQMHVAGIYRSDPPLIGNPPLMPDGFWSAVTDVDGQCIINHVPKGMAVYIDHDDPRFAQTPGAHSTKYGRIAGSNEDEIRLLPASAIRGRVVFPDGSPVPNVTVQALEHTPYVQGGADAKVLTDGDGRFEMDRMLPATYGLQASLEGKLQKDWISEIRAVSLSEGEFLQDQNVTLIKGVLVTGRVTIEETNEPLEGHTLGGTAVNQTSPLEQWWGKTREDGTYQMRLTPGLKRVYYAQGAPPPGLLAPDPNSVDFEAEDGEHLTLDFELRLAPWADTVSGVVLDVSGNPLPQAIVYLVRTWDNTHGGGIEPLPWSTTNELGEFQIAFPEFLKSDFPYFLYAVHTERISELIEVKRGDRVALQLLEQDRLAHFQGRIVDEAGNPIKGASITWFHKDIMNDLWFRRSTLSDVEGKFEFKHMWANQPIYFSVNAEGYQRGSYPEIQAVEGETLVLPDMVLQAEE